VHAALHDLDAILEHATHPVAACIAIIFITRQPLRAHQIYSSRFDDDDDERILDRAAWSPDWTAVETPTPAQLRERFPRLTANLGDIQLSGPFDAARLSTYERQRLAINLLERAKATADDRAKLELLDRADALWPSHQEIRGARGRVHARIGNLDTALADFDAVLAVSPDATRTQWERSKVRLARGDRDGALADARAVAQYVDEARGWLAEQARITPKRVRHVKFGEGVVVSADTTGAEPKLVIDFASGRKTIASRFVDAIE
jgi:tetratricopeptide (TPR) repeat protein